MITFKYVPAEDPSMDDDYLMMVNGKEANFGIQDAHRYHGGYVVNRYFYNKRGELDGVELMSIHRSLAKAKTAAIKLHNKS